VGRSQKFWFAILFFVVAGIDLVMQSIEQSVMAIIFSIAISRCEERLIFLRNLMHLIIGGSGAVTIPAV
jgi:hypothetical protein